jgi:hypothetical protein
MNAMDSAIAARFLDPNLASDAFIEAPSPFAVGDTSGSLAFNLPSGRNLGSFRPYEADHSIDRPTVLAAIGTVGRFVHPNRNHHAGSERQSSDNPHRTGKTESVSRDPGNDGADGVAKIAPEAVDTDCGRSPRWLGDIADGRKKCRVDHRGADAEHDRT